MNNSNNIGWVREHRAEFNAPIFARGPKCRYAAWRYLVQHARWESGTQTIRLTNGQLIRVERGQLVASQGYLAKTWNWSRDKVRSFIEALRKQAYIELDTACGESLITILNYAEKYPAQKYEPAENYPQGYPHPNPQGSTQVNPQGNPQGVSTEKSTTTGATEEVRSSNPQGYPQGSTHPNPQGSTQGYPHKLKKLRIEEVKNTSTTPSSLAENQKNENSGFAALAERLRADSGELNFQANYHKIPRAEVSALLEDFLAYKLHRGQATHTEYTDLANNFSSWLAKRPAPTGGKTTSTKPVKSDHATRTTFARRKKRDTGDPAAYDYSRHEAAFRQRHHLD